MHIDVNNFFCSSSGSGDIREKPKFQKQLDLFFVTHCTSKIFGPLTLIALTWKILADGRHAMQNEIRGLTDKFPFHLITLDRSSFWHEHFRN